MNKTFFLFPLTLFLLFILRIEPAAAQPEGFERLRINIKASVKWEEITNDHNGIPLHKTFGSYTVNIDGFMKMNDKASRVVSRNGIMVMPVETYETDMIKVSMSFDEEWQELRETPICDNPLIERYHGNTTQEITIGPNLMIYNFGSAMKPFMKNLSKKQEEQISSFEQMSIMPDYYQIAIGGGNTIGTTSKKITVQGTSRKSDCTFQDVEKRFPGFTIGLQMQMPKSGEMGGRESWEADCDGVFPPSFGIKVSDMGVHGGEKPYNPPRKNNGNATYTLEWKFGN